jgi:hypothetical protein
MTRGLKFPVHDVPVFFIFCFNPLGLFEFSFPRRTPFSADAWVQGIMTLGGGVSTTISVN